MNSPPQHQGANATDPSTIATPVTTPTKPTTNAYHAGFEQHLIDHEVHPPTFASQGPEWAEIMEALDRRRPSLSPSLFSSTNFDTFRARNFAAKNEAAVLRAVIPTITGPIEADPLCLPNAQFAKLKPLTDGTIVPAKPDFYYGADPKDLDRSIRDELAGDIIPSAWEDRPMVPNFFLEVKGPKGTSGVATLQACYDGALGSRAMHSLQNYNQEQPRYDGKPYTFSSTYECGCLNIFAHSITKPTTAQGRPQYHMNLVASWSLIGTLDNFCRGVSAFRNVRDLAKDYRDRFILEANAKRFQAHEHDLSAPPVSGDPASCIPLPDADDGQPQQHVDEGEGTSQSPVLPGDDPSLSFFPCSPSSPTPSSF
uniref:Uncharacterized protein n=1 Tax=Bionectria ochroleuca TaxID=29856 RepID=A0A8H7NNY8_BIOOC